ncbi:MAG: phage tail protein [Alphaproteobacteria bacterium]|nr:phage tail protein [Alphaproteobacteria bacterium]
MASVVLKSVGAAVGDAFLPGLGGSLLGGLAGNLGGIVDSQLGLGVTVTGPRLENLSVQDSRYGAGIPIVYGNARIAGNVIWSTDFIETQHTSTAGGKGGGSVTTKTYTYSVHCAVGICAGPIAGINTIWADTTVIYQDGTWVSDLFDGVGIYLGSDDQAPDSFMESVIGLGAVPAYNGLAYIVFDNFQLAGFGSRIPNLTFEIAAAAETDAPSCLGQTELSFSQRSSSMKNGTMMPIVLQSNGTNVQKVLIGGVTVSGTTAAFTAVETYVLGETPSPQDAVSSDTFPITTPFADSAWALSPDERFVAFYIQSSTTLSHSFALYDRETEAFGPVLSRTMDRTSTCKQIAWLDSQRFVIDDVESGVRGVRVFARSGTAVVDLGFTGLWGANSAASSALLGGAQFASYADGLLAFNLVSSSKAWRARTLVWRNGALELGDAYAVSDSLALGTGSGPHAQLLRTGDDELTLVYNTVLYTCLMSFEPSDTGVVITRPWQKLTPSFGTGTTTFPVVFGKTILLVQTGTMSYNYLISDVTLDDGSFTVAVDAAEVAGIDNDYTVFAALKLNSARLLFLATGTSSYTFKQVALFSRCASDSVAVVLEDILFRAGYASEDVDVSALANTAIQGYVLQEPLSARKAVEPLQTFAPFDLIETGGQLRAILRGGDVAVSVPASEWRAALEDEEQPAPLLLTRAQEIDLPLEVALDVIDPARNYEVNCQRARRLACAARTVQKISLPIVCSAAAAKKVAETKLYTAWAERDMVRLSLSRAWLALDPSDVIDIGLDRPFRIASVVLKGGVVTVEGFYSYASALESAAAVDDDDNTASASLNAPVASSLYLMDLPLLRTADDQPGVYVAVTGCDGWKSAEVLRSSDGASYAAFASVSAAAVGGMATSILGDGSPYYCDNANTVTVQVIAGELESCSWEDMSNGANAALLGDEIIQFQNATLTGPGLYTLSRLLRGRRGTEDACASHALGEAFVLLDTTSVAFVPDTLSDRGRSFSFRALSTGQSLSDAKDYTFAYGMKTLCPLAPVHLRAVRSALGDVTFSWVRRARLDAEWVDYIDVPLDEISEAYALSILNGDETVRTFSDLTEASATYSAAQQSEDWGAAIPASFSVSVCQISDRYGCGAALTAVL